MKIKTIIFVVLAFFLSNSSLLAQSKKTIKEQNISYVLEKEIDYEDGLDVERKLQETWYNQSGLVVEYKDWNKEGEVKVWEKYEYNDDKTLKEKQELNKKGVLRRKVIYAYRNGLLVKKSYYDKKDRLEKEKIYEYDVHK